MRRSDDNDPTADFDEKRGAVSPPLSAEARMNVAPPERRNVRSSGHMQLPHERASREFDLLQVGHSVKRSGSRQAFVAHLAIPLTVRFVKHINNKHPALLTHPVE